MSRIYRQKSELPIALEYAGRHWSAGFGALDITPGFRTPLGFTPRTDYALLTGFLNYRWQSIGFFRQVAARLRFEDAYDHQPGGGIGRYHQHTDRVVSSYLDFTLPAATSFSFGYTRLFLRVDGTEFSGLDRGFLFLGSEAWRWFGWNLFLRAGDEVIYTDLVDDGPAQPSSFVNLSLATSTRPIAPLRLALNLTTSTIWRRTVARARDTRYAQSAIPRLRVQAQISRALGLRLIGEYRFEQFFRRDGALDSQRKVLGADILATYLVHPGQSLQLGWSLRAAGNLELPLRNVARGGVVKVAYLWRL